MSKSVASKRRSNYKSRRSVPGGAANELFFPHEESTHEVFLRDRMKAKCVEKLSKDRAKARLKKYGDAHQGSSSDGDLSSDMEMEDEGIDELDDPMLQRVMAAETRRERHRQQYLFERQVGSSFDPDIEDMDAWETYSDDEDVPDDVFDDAHEFELADYEEHIDPPEDRCGPTDSQTSDAEQSRNDFLNHLLQSACPSCRHSPLTINVDAAHSISCQGCSRSYLLAEAAASWAEDHPDSNRYHVPRWILDPMDGHTILLECCSPDCIWLENL